MEEVTCRHCLTRMPRGATVCPACQTHQGVIRANLGFLSSGATLLVAIASLATSLYGLRSVQARAHVPKSEIRLTAPLIHDGFVTLNAVNVGDAAGSLRAVTIESPLLGGALPLTSSSADDEFVPVGAKRVTFRFRGRLNVEDQRKAREQADLMPSDDDKAGIFNIMIVESDGTEKFSDLPIPKGRFVALENERMSADPSEDDPGNSSGP